MRCRESSLAVCRPAGLSSSPRVRSGSPAEVIENLEELEDDGELYESIEDIWPDYPRHDDFFFNEDEY